jgi:hypothetical protein
MDSDKIISGIVVALIVILASLFLKPLLAEVPILGSILRGAGEGAGWIIVDGVGSSRPRDLCANAAEHWNSTEGSGRRAAYADHLERFPQCDFAKLAKMRIEELDTDQETRRLEEETRPSAAVETARRQAEEETRRAEEERQRAAEETARRQAEEDRRRAEEERQRAAGDIARRKAEEERRRELIEVVRRDRCKALSVCPAGEIFSLARGECVLIQHYGGVIPGSEDDARFDPRTATWVPNC